MRYYQQGDVLVKESEFKKEGLKLIRSGIVKFGSATGHAHTLKNGKLYQVNDDTMFIIANDKTTLDHDEHGSIKIDSGSYKIEIVKEYDHWTEESKEVID